nr:HlyD family efflux transporter periplasmic adaptor subunit [uncultured Sphingomonas sp.]
MENSARKVCILAGVFTALQACGSGDRDLNHDLSSAVSSHYLFTAGGRIERDGGVRRVGTEGSGLIARLLVEEGDAVAPGQPVAVLQGCEDFAAALDEAQADLASSRAQSAKINKGSRPEEIAQAEASVRESSARLGVAQDNLNRVKALQSRGFVAERSLLEAQGATDAAEAGLSRAQAAAEILRQGSRSEEKQASQAEVRAAEARLAGSSHQRRKCIIRSTVAGTVARILKRPGEQISAVYPEAVMLLTSNSGAVRIRAEVDQRDAPNVRIGQKADFWLEGEKAIFPGKVVSSSGILQSLFSDDPSEAYGRQVEEVLIEPLRGHPRPINGLRVIVGFSGGMPANKRN